MSQSSTTQWKNQLRQERIAHNWRQQDVADQLGTTAVTVKRWERGSQQPSMFFRLKLCALFGKSAEELGLVAPCSPLEAKEHTLIESATPRNNAPEVALCGQTELLSLQSLHMWEQAFGPIHHNLIYLLNGLARFSFHQGKYEQADILFLRALSICAQTMGSQAPEMAETLHSLAILREAQGENHVAMLLYQRALTIWEKVLGADHQHTNEIRTQYQRLLQLIGEGQEMEIVKSP